MRIYLENVKIYCVITLIFLSLAAVSNCSHAAEKVAFGVGQFDFLDDEDSLEIRAEYRFDKSITYNIKPFIGLQTTTDKAFHGLIGIYKDIQLTDKIDITPSLGTGIYTNGRGPDLNSFIQFRSMIEIGYNITEEYKISIGASHTSNAGFGAGNSGAESAILYIHRAWP